MHVYVLYCVQGEDDVQVHVSIQTEINKHRLQYMFLMNTPR